MNTGDKIDRLLRREAIKTWCKRGLVALLCLAIIIPAAIFGAGRMRIRGTVHSMATAWCAEKYGISVKVLGIQASAFSIQQLPNYYDVAVDDGAQTYWVRVYPHTLGYTPNVFDTAQTGEVSAALQEYVVQTLGLPPPDHTLLQSVFLPGRGGAIYTSIYYNGNNIADICEEVFPSYLFLYTGSEELDARIQALEPTLESPTKFVPNAVAVQLSGPQAATQIMEEYTGTAVDLAAYASGISHTTYFEIHDGAAQAQATQYYTA